MPPYVPVAQSLNACSAAEITAFITACDSTSATTTTCDSWLSDSSNAACLACILPANDAGAPTNTGALLVSADNTFVVNLPGCLALQDPTQGPMCAANLEPYEQCVLFACSSCTTASDYTTCEQTAAASGGACNGYLTGTQTACATDFGDAGAGTTTCSTDTDVITVICGSGQ